MDDKASVNRLPGRVVGKTNRPRNDEYQEVKKDPKVVLQGVNHRQGQQNWFVVDASKQIHNNIDSSSTATAMRPPPPPPPPIPNDNEKGLLYQISIPILRRRETDTDEDESHNWTFFQRSIQWEPVMGGTSGVHPDAPAVNDQVWNSHHSAAPQAQRILSRGNNRSGFGARVQRKFEVAESNTSRVPYLSSISEGDTLHSIDGHWVKTLSFEIIQNKLQQAFCRQGNTPALVSPSEGRPPPQSVQGNAFPTFVSLTFLRKETEQRNPKTSPSSAAVHQTTRPDLKNPNALKFETEKVNVHVDTHAKVLSPAPTTLQTSVPETPVMEHRSFDTLLTNNTDLSQSFSNEAFLPSIFKNNTSDDGLNSSLAKNILMSSPMLSDDNEIVALHAGIPLAGKSIAKSYHGNMTRGYAVERRQLEHDYEEEALPDAPIGDAKSKWSTSNDTGSSNMSTLSPIAPSPDNHRKRPTTRRFSSRASPAKTPSMPPIHEIDTTVSSRSSPSSKSSTRNAKKPKDYNPSSPSFEDPEKPPDLKVLDGSFIKHCSDVSTLERIIEYLTNPTIKYPTLLKVAQDRLGSLEACISNHQALSSRYSQTPCLPQPEPAEPPTPYSFVTAQESISFANSPDIDGTFETPHGKNCPSISISDEHASLISDTTSSVRSSYTNENESFESGESGLVSKSPKKAADEGAVTTLQFSQSSVGHENVSSKRAQPQSTQKLSSSHHGVEKNDRWQQEHNPSFSSSSSSISVEPEKRQEVIHLNVQVTRLKGKLKQMETLLESQNISYTAKLESLDRKKAAAEEEINIMKELIVEQSVNQEDLELQLRKRSLEISDMEQQMKTQRERMQDETRNTAKEHGALQQQIEELKEQLHRQEAKHTALSKKARTDFDSMIAQKDLKQRNHTKRLESELGSAQEEIRKLSEKSFSLAQRLETALKENSESRREVEELAAKANREAERSARYKSKYQQAKERYKLAEGVVDAMEESITEQERTMTNLIQSHKELEDLCDELKSSKRRDSDELLKCRKRIAQLEKEVLESRQRLDQMKTKEVSLNEEARMASQETLDARTQIAQLENELKSVGLSKQSEWTVKEENYKLQLIKSQRKWEKDLEAKNSEIEELQGRIKVLESLVSKQQQNKSKIKGALQNTAKNERNISQSPLRQLSASASKHLTGTAMVHPKEGNIANKSFIDIMSENDNVMDPPSIQSKSEAWKAQYAAMKKVGKTPAFVDTEFIHPTSDSSSAKENHFPASAPRKVTPTSIDSTPITFQNTRPSTTTGRTELSTYPSSTEIASATTAAKEESSASNTKSDSRTSTNLTSDAKPSSLMKGSRAALKAKLLKVRGSSARQALQ